MNRVCPQVQPETHMRCVVLLGVEHDVHRDAFGAEWRIEDFVVEDDGRRAIATWAPLDEKALTSSPKGVLKRMRALGLEVEILVATVEVDTVYYAGDSKDGTKKAGDLKKPYHHVRSQALLARNAHGRPLRIAAFWDTELTEKGKTTFGDARWIVDGTPGWTKVASGLTAVLDALEPVPDAEAAA